MSYTTYGITIAYGKNFFEFNEDGKLVTKLKIPMQINEANNSSQLLDDTFETEQVLSITNLDSKIEKQRKLTQQSFRIGCRLFSDMYDY